MAILHKEKIIDLYNKGDLKIDPFSEKHVEPASYDLVLGKILKAGTGTVNLGSRLIQIQ